MPNRFKLGCKDMLGIVLNILLLTSIANSLDICEKHRSCVECTEADFKCGWNANGKCQLRPLNVTDKGIYLYDDTCPINYSTREELFPANWMGNILSVIGENTLLDLSLPGTHDTLTHDLSTKVSEGGIDDFVLLAEVLHNYTSIIPSK